MCKQLFQFIVSALNKCMLSCSKQFYFALHVRLNFFSPSHLYLNINQLTLLRTTLSVYTTLPVITWSMYLERAVRLYRTDYSYLKCIFMKISEVNGSHTSSFCACGSGSASDAFPCVGVSSLSLDSALRLLPWNERIGGVLNDARMNCLHP